MEGELGPCDPLSNCSPSGLREMREVFASTKVSSVSVADRHHLLFFGPGEQPNPTVKPDIHVKKIMLSVWWNNKVLVDFELLQPGQTATSDLYKQELDRVNETLIR
ncbi:unnamed protein product, partial [Mesorhabditis belari]|uniref:Uncharacterized protein n=1 Tax=Mesorhabditis belari TaxID=2138241 RepID=A0AAF3F2P5_9BILA